MIREGMTRKEAAQEWVNGFNAVPSGMIKKLWQADLDNWCEVTRPSVGDRVYASEFGSGKVIEVNREDRQCKIELNDDRIVWQDEEQVDFDSLDSLPMWGTMWSFGDSLDEYWLEELDGIAQMSDCGFRIYKSEEFGYFFGIDGAGYDFYEQHWIPLYEKRGLKWHDPKAEVAAS